jgi:Pectate lyase superfamily protein/SMP-30/Gluconolactonase/LRE-like region
VPVPNVVPREKKVRDANSGTFYSSMSNIDVKIGRNNPSAVGVRFRVAQHGILSHMNFDLGSAFAGVYMAGNVFRDVHFRGGRYGIVSEKTSPAWQFMLLDATFDGQRDAAIREHEADLTMKNVAIRNTPVGIEINKGYSDSLFGMDMRFENVSKAAVLISNEGSAFTQVGFMNVVATRTPIFARFRDSGKTVTHAGSYRVDEFTYGLTLAGLGDHGTFETRFKAAPIAKLPAPAPSAIRDLPPTSEWVNVRDHGVKGDGKTDDTAALRAVIDKHRVLYFPTGFYIVTDTLLLKPDTMLIGLHPSTTQIALPDNAPGYAGIGTAKAIIEAPKGGTNVISSIGVFAGRINPRATDILWKAGENSLIDDVKIQGGGGTVISDGKQQNIFATPGGDQVAANYWDEQHPGIWVTDGGGGTFNAIWAPNTFAQAGFVVSDTKTPGRVYQLSAEHHVRVEIVLDGVENWEFLAPQTEQEVGDGPFAVSTEIRNSRNILFANYHGYRVTRSYRPMDSAVKLYNSSDIRFRNVHVNAESGYATCDANGCATYLRASKFPFENAIEDKTTKQIVREREFAVLDIPANPAVTPPAPLPDVFPAGAKLKKLEEGFWSISGAAVDDAGKLYFVEHRFHRIYSWDAKGGIAIVRDQPIDPVNLAFDSSGNLLVLSSLGPEASVYSFKPGTKDGSITLISPTPARARADARTIIPVNYWNNGEFRDQYDPVTDHFTTLAEMFARDVAKPQSREYVSPDGSLVLPAYRVFQQGPPSHQGWRFSDSLDAYGFTTAKPGERVFISNESEDRTFSGLLGQHGAITDLKLFAERGGESVAVDANGNVFIADGQVFVFDAAGKPRGRIDVPDRPLQLIFGGADRRTLFILTHHALYAVAP